jgi:putative oxidoreductase
MTTLSDVSMLSAGLLVVRLVLGLLLAAHGAQKLLGWFGGPGLAAVAGGFDSMGFRPGRLFAAVASLTEISAGLLLALGFLGPIGPALAISVMIVAMGSVHWKNGMFAANNGIEVPLLYATGAAALLLTGPGEFSLDAILGLGSLLTPVLQVTLLIIGVLGGLVNLLARRPVVAKAA